MEQINNILNVMVSELGIDPGDGGGRAEIIGVATSALTELFECKTAGLVVPPELQPIIPLTPEQARILQAPFPAYAYTGQEKSKGFPPKVNGKEDKGAPKWEWNYRYYEVGYKGMHGPNRLNSVFPGRWGVVPHDYDYREFTYDSTKKGYVMREGKSVWEEKTYSAKGMSVSCDVDLFFDGKLVTSQPGGHTLKKYGETATAGDIGMARKSAVTDATKRLLFLAFGIGWEFYMGVVTEKMCVDAMRMADKYPYKIPVANREFVCWAGYSQVVASEESDATDPEPEKSSEEPNRSLFADDVLRLKMLYETLAWKESKLAAHYNKATVAEMSDEEVIDAVKRMEGFISKQVTLNKIKLPMGKCKKCTRNLPLVGSETVIMHLGVCSDCLESEDSAQG